MAQPEPGSQDEPGQDQDGWDREAIQKLKVEKLSMVKSFQYRKVGDMAVVAAQW